MAHLKTQGFEVFLLDDADTGNEVRKIAQISGTNGLGGSATEIPITNFDSLRQEFLVGLADSGSLTLNLDFDPADAGHTTLQSLQGGANKRFFLAGSEAGTDPSYSSGYTLPTDRTSWDFNAGVQQFQLDMSADDVVRGTVTLRISGAVTFTAAS